MRDRPHFTAQHNVAKDNAENLFFFVEAEFQLRTSKIHSQYLTGAISGASYDIGKVWLQVVSQQ